MIARHRDSTKRNFGAIAPPGGRFVRPLQQTPAHLPMGVSRSARQGGRQSEIDFDGETFCKRKINGCGRDT